MSWLSKYILDPLKKDVEGFFASGSPVSTQIKTSVAAVGATALAQVDPVVSTAEAAVESAIDAALATLGNVGVIAEAGVAVVYPLLASALNDAIAKKLGVPAPAAPAG